MKNKIICKVLLFSAALSGSLALTGCDGEPRLEVSPASIAFDAGQSERRLTLNNLGSRPFEWTLEVVARASEEEEWASAEAAWLTIDKMSGRLAPGLEHITLTADRSNLSPGSYTNFALRIRAGDNVEKIIPISLIVERSLVVLPDIITLSSGDLSAEFVVENRGTAALTWSAAYFDGNDPSVGAGPLPADMVMTPNGGALARENSVKVSLNWLLPRTDFGLLFTSPQAPGHTAVLLFRVSAPLTNLTVTPEILTLYYSRPAQSGGMETPEQPASKLTLLNTSSYPLQWGITLRTRGEALDQSPIPIAVDVVSGTLAAGSTTVVEVKVSDAQTAIAGEGNYEIAVTVHDQEGAVIVPLVLESVSLPVIVASDPPNPEALRPEPTYLRYLDFGRDDVQKEFYILNVGPLESKLYFRIVHDDQESETPLILDVAPAEGNTNGPNSVFYLPGTNYIVDARRILVTIDRTVMTEDIEYRNLYIEAWDQDYQARIEAVARWQIELRAERPPLKVEGAINRSRPPYLMRFIFMLRDTLGQIIPTRTPEDLARIHFDISEDGAPLDLNEVSMQINGPEQLKVNMVVMLDYTGSMYYAGVDNLDNPRKPGELLDEIREATAMFLDDLPPSYRVALMYHNDRQPLNRLIHPFTTDREALKSALKNYTVPPALHGVSDIWDALVDASLRLAAEDPDETLPFDDADVRAIVFISDGNDNASVEDASRVESIAQDLNVRLYPLVYNIGESINYSELAPLAEETGGHFYNAGTPENLEYLLGHKRGLVLQPITQSSASDQVAFKVKNAGKTPMSWTAFLEGSPAWVTSIVPMGAVIPPRGESVVTVTVNPNHLTSPYRVGQAAITINSDNGAGQVLISLSLQENDAAVQNLSASLRDEPGQIWEELQNQVVLSYVTPSQTGGKYSIRVRYQPPEGDEISGFFEKDGVFFPGDIRAGQISLHTTGITLNYDAETLEDVARAEVYVRADYVPRNVNLFRMRFYPREDLLTQELAQALALSTMKVEIAPEGLLVYQDGSRPDWRLAPEMDGVYRLLTAREYPLPYAASGSLLRITFTNLLPFVEAAAAAGVEYDFMLDMRVDNEVYFALATPTRPSETVYFLYPSGPKNPTRQLRIGDGSDLAAPAFGVEDLMVPGINPEASGAWDRDEDNLPDFFDPFPDSNALPESMVIPDPVLFTATTLDAEIQVYNNRLDTFTWRPYIITSAVNQLTAEYFEWYVQDETGSWIQWDDPNNGPYGILAPGESVRLMLRLDPGSLPAGFYTTKLELLPEPFESVFVDIRVQL